MGRWESSGIKQAGGWLLAIAVVGLLVAGCTGAKKSPTVAPGATVTPAEEARTGVTPSPGPGSRNTQTPVAQATPTPRPGTEVSGFRFTVSGTVVSDGGAPLDAVQVTARAEGGRTTAEGSTETDGKFRLQLEAGMLPVRVLAEVSLSGVGVPTVTNARWHLVEASGQSRLGSILLPEVGQARLDLSAGVARSDDGSDEVHGVPAEVAAVFARTYDPDETPDAFPGEFAEEGGVRLDSAVFMWISALDAGGSEVGQLSTSVTSRVKVPPAQWVDLEDIDQGTGRIELPIYAFDDVDGAWRQEAAAGWLEDGAGTVLPEEAQPVVLDGSFAGELYAAFQTDHFSWLNVDYPYIGPWTLSRLSSSQRGNTCLLNAVTLAQAIALSAIGQTAYAAVNLPGANLADELAEGEGPEIERVPLTDAYGEYAGDAGGLEDQFTMDTDLWDQCGPSATADEQQNITLVMAITILHETAHWKDDVAGHPDDDGDTEGEEGTQLELDIFGGFITNGDGLMIDGEPLEVEVRDFWLDPDNWLPPGSAAPGGGGLLAAPLVRLDQQEGSPLQVEISTDSQKYSLGEALPVSVVYTNVSGQPIQVLDRMVLEGWPAYFNILDEDGVRTRFLAPEVKLKVTSGDFITLPPGGSLTLEVDLTRDTERGVLHYQLVRPGAHQVTMMYEGLFRGVSIAQSNTLTLELVDGGRVTGTVSDAVTGEALPGATVAAYQGGRLLDLATADATGHYALTLPSVDAGASTGASSTDDLAHAGFGPYRLEARAHGYLRSVREDVSVASGVDTVVDFAMSDLLASGEIRIVLSYPPPDEGIPFPHLWLPEELPYHVYFNRRGSLTECPGAELEVTAFALLGGPQTVTIGELQPAAGNYLYAVHNFLGSPALPDWEARVQVYDATGLIATYQVPTGGSGDWWHVLEIDAADRTVHGLNILGADPSPYGDTAEGCGVVAVPTPTPRPSGSLPSLYVNANLPQYPGAVVVDPGREVSSLRDGVRIGLESSDAVEAIVGFYEEAFQAQGWSVPEQRFPVANLYLSTYSKGDLRFQLTIAHPVQDEPTSITISYRQE